jgi:hypothetical protein
MVQNHLLLRPYCQRQLNQVFSDQGAEAYPRWVARTSQAAADPAHPQADSLEPP